MKNKRSEKNSPVVPVELVNKYKIAYQKKSQTYVDARKSLGIFTQEVLVKLTRQGSQVSILHQCKDTGSSIIIWNKYKFATSITHQQRTPITVPDEITSFVQCVPQLGKLKNIIVKNTD